MLWEKQIYSCPVVDETGKVINVLDLFDVVYFHLAAAKVGQDIVFQRLLTPEAKAEARAGKVQTPWDLLKLTA
jgi:hypothetical protein